jgi:hypothetical protein
LLLPRWVRRREHEQREAGARRLTLRCGVAALVPAPVVVLAAVRRAEGPGLVVLLLAVAVEVLEREAVVGHEEVDRVPRPAAVVAVEVRGPRDARGDRARGDLRQAELVLVGAERVPKGRVPLGPAGRELAELVGAAADPPRLRDQVHARAALLGPQRQLAHGAVQGVATVHLVEVEAVHLVDVAEHRGQVEAEAVDAEHVLPVAERVDDQVARRLRGAVHVPAAAGVVVVVLPVLRQLVGVPSASVREVARKSRWDGRRWPPRSARLT